MKIINANNRRIIRTIQFPEKAKSISVHPYQPIIAVGGGNSVGRWEKNGYIVLYDYENDKEIFRKSDLVDVKNITFSPDGNYLAMIHVNGFEPSEVMPSNVLAALNMHMDQMENEAFFSVFNLKSKSIVQIPDHKIDSGRYEIFHPVLSIDQFSKKVAFSVFVEDEKYLIIANLKTGEVIKKIKTDGLVTAAAFLPDEHKICIGLLNSDASFNVIDIITEKMTGIIPKTDEPVFRLLYNYPKKEIYVPNGNIVYIFNKLDSIVRLQCLVENILPNSVAEKAGLRAGDLIEAIDDYIPTDSDDLFNKLISRDKCTLKIKRNDEEVKLIVLNKGQAGRYGIKIRSGVVEDESLRYIIHEPEDVYSQRLPVIRDMKTDVSGNWLFSLGGDNSIILWDIEKREKIRTYSFVEKEPLIKRYNSDNSDSRLIDSSAQNEMLFYDSNIGHYLEKYAYEYSLGEITRLAFYPNDPKRLAIAYKSGLLVNWDLDRLSPVSSFYAHQGAITGMAFCTERNQLATSGTDGLIRLWQLPEFSLIKVLDERGSVNAMDLHNNCEILVSASNGAFSDGNELKIWDLIRDKHSYNNYDVFRTITSLKFIPNTVKPTAILNSLHYWMIEDEYPIKIIDLDGAVLDSFEAEHVYALDVNPIQSNEFVTGGASGILYIWETENPKPVRMLRATSATGLSTMSAVKYSPDSKQIATGHWDNTIRLWDLKLNKQIQKLTGHENWISSLAYNSDGTLLASGSFDGTVKIWSPKTGENILTIVSKDSAAHVIFSKERYYRSTKDGLKNVVYRDGLTDYPFEQFDLRYNRPDILVSKLPNASKEIATAYHKSYQKRLQKMGFKEEMLFGNMNLPEIKIIANALPVNTTDENIEINIMASDARHYLDRINIYINDVPVYGIKGVGLRHRNVYQYEQIFHLPLCRGENKIQCSVLNQNGVESLKETVYLTRIAPERKPDLYLIGIGAGTFHNSDMNLAYPVKDIRDVVRFFQTDSVGNIYGRIFIDTLIDASLDIGRLNLLKQKLMHAQADDRVVVFVAGHGIIDDNLDYYFATHHTDFSRPKTTAIPYEELENLLDSIPALQKMMLVDACFAGEIDKESVDLIKSMQTTTSNLKFRSFSKNPVPKRLGLENSSDLMKELFVDLRRGTGATVIASAGGMEFAVEGEHWQNSDFTYALLAGLKNGKADLDKNGAVMVSELQQYLAKEVSNLTNNQQRPTFRLENISNDWRVW